ncbi:MAG: AEC family transporter [Cyanobacteria bacterium Co-bin8]|nr:AEC family transporter [Cyanobacteria bacterium Co-bin8]
MLVLVRLYIPLVATVLLGVGVSALLALPVVQRVGGGLAARAPVALGQFLFWVGVPLGIISFLHRANLSEGVFLAPVVAWSAMLLCLGCGSLWLKPYRKRWSRPSQGSFSLASMLGNTGSIGYPVVLLLPQLGPDYFGWALLYDALGTLPGAYGFGVVLASRYGDRPLPRSEAAARWLTPVLQVVGNPNIIAFFVAIALRPVPFPPLLDQGLYGFAWLGVMLSLVLMGMRLQQITSWRALQPATIAVSIKMLLIPLVIGIALTLIGLDGPSRLVLVVQAGMPCAFANLILAEAYSLDRQLTVTCVGLSSGLLLLTLPLWLWGFAP